jgi:GNAT superfamily N-acetyltransferase
MMRPAWSVEPISRSHDRAAFDCGVESLNEYLRRYARQNARLGVSRTYVAVGGAATQVAGFYSLAMGQVEFASLPEPVKRRLPGYPVPAARLARLAVDRRRQGQGLGAVLLADALARVLGVSEEIGVAVVTVDVLNDAAAGFYRHFGFEPLLDDPRHLYLPVAAIAPAAS